MAHPQGALNHHLELVFGPRHVNQPIQLKGRGSSLEAIVDVLHHHLTGEAGENVLLWNWVEDLTRAAQEHKKTVSFDGLQMHAYILKSLPVANTKD
jgi:hypothetical protein